MNRREFSLRVAGTAGLGLMATGAAQAQGAPVEGTNYVKLSQPVPVSPTGKVEVPTLGLHAIDDPTAFVELEAAYDEHSVLRIDVYDRSPGEVNPEPKNPGLGAEGGRGLAIVARLSSKWGVDPLAQGKRVWFTLSTSTPAA